MVTQITTDLTPVPNAMSPGTFSAYTDAFLPKLPTWADEANAIAAEVNANAVIAAASVEEILSTANFDGAWTAKAYAAYVSVAYLDLFWMSNAITAARDVPGVSTKWTLLSRNTGFKNFVLDGNFLLWDDGTSFTSSASQYTAIMWKTFAATNSLVDKVTKSDGRSALRFRRGTNTTASQCVVSYVEIPQYLKGTTFNLSFKIKFNVASPQFAVVGKWGDGAGIVTFTSATLSRADTTTEQIFTAPVVIPSDGTSYAIFSLIFYGNITGTTEYDFEISQAQFERGSVRTDFEYRPKALERKLCEPFYYRIDATTGNTFGPAFHSATTISRVVTKLPSMRVAPTALLQSGTASDYGVLEDATSVVCNSVPTFAYANTEYAITLFPVASGLTAGKGSYGRAAATTFLAWSARF